MPVSPMPIQAVFPIADVKPQYQPRSLSALLMTMGKFDYSPIPSETPDHLTGGRFDVLGKCAEALAVEKTRLPEPGQSQKVLAFANGLVGQETEGVPITQMNGVVQRDANYSFVPIGV